ncbi:putative ABC transporter ATP-binding protein [Collinsella intestinalis]|uniref:Fatty acid ABC transporter ATP-binding/permease protein n=1 Tax=Collinsella intestinalis TaxID=147207 RepID=A0A5K1ISA0_9ACTN|nr:ABC transporter ATP-binding protein [Collinsella intestinalis]VWL91372.1 putative ABC transporter ATP-binding protein [Collinsella intestinalis]
MPAHMRHGHGPTTEKAKDFKGAVVKVVRYIAHDKLALFVAIACAVGSVAFNVMGPRVLGEATTELFRGIAAKVGGTGGVDFALIGRILATVLCIYIASSALSLVQGWLMTGVTQRVCYRLRRQIIEKIDRMPLAYFERVSTGDVMSRVTNDVDTLGQSLNQSVTQLITSVAQLIGVSVQMLSISVALAGVTFLTIPLSLLGVVLVVRASQRHFRRQQVFLGSANGIIEESFAGQTLIQAYNRAERALGEFDEVNEKLYESGWRAQFLSGVMQPIMGLVGNLGYVAVVMMSAFLMISGRITVGNAQAFFQYIRNFTQPITQLSQVSNMLQMLAAAAERIFEFLDEDEEDDPVPLSESLRATGSVEFDHVRFGYIPEKTVIHDFNCSVEPGQTVAIVGPTGAGKTTLMKLLMRFYDVNAGSIRVNGADVRSLPREDLRSNFAMVLQDTWLFKGSIRENIRYGNIEADDAMVEAAARTALADHFIRTLPGGYDFELNEDASNVSQGQRQLITIARALLADRPILILDEATSNVDTRTEERIQRAMDILMAGRTSFVIAHRLSTIRSADVILVLRDGDIVESGSHEELLARGGFYAELYNSQFDEGADE